MPDHQRAPILDMLRGYRAEGRMETCIPGHRGGLDADPDTLDLLGRGAFFADVTQVPDMDDHIDPRGPIAEAQSLAADLYGARRTWFLTNGTTSGIQAAILATSGPGTTVAAPRAAHRCVLEGLILSGAQPRWLPCRVDPVFGCALPPHPEAIADALRDTPALLVLTRPTYFGDVADVRRIADSVPGGTMMLADEAWGAHLGLHPQTPPSACRAGADLVVNSTHKTLTALSGGAMLHACSERVDPERVAAAVALLTTTSAYYGVLASLDGARRQAATDGRERVARALQAGRAARAALQGVAGLDVAGPERSALPEVAAYDETRLVVSAARLGWAGYDLEERLRTQYRVQVELADEHAVVATLGALDAADGRVERLVSALAALAAETHSSTAQRLRVPLPPDMAPIRMTPREAFMAPHRVVAREAAAGRVSAEVVCPYPPGIPVLIPGETVTREALDFLCETLEEGGRLQGCADPTLSTIRVVH